MDVWSVPPMDTRGLFGEERRDLLSLLDRLTADQWAESTLAEGWTVKDIALHLLDGDLGRLSRERDADTTGLLPHGGPAATFAAALHEKNQRWLDAARQLSPRVTRDLLAYSTEQLQEWTAEADLLAPTRVSWASDKPVPAWLDLARELTETWVHHQQIRAAIGRETGTDRLPTVLRTFVWALPHQYRVPAEPQTTVLLDLDIGGQWSLVAGNEGRWSLHEGAISDPVAYIRFTAEAAWRSFTGAAIPRGGITYAGPSQLTDPMQDVRGIIV
ncbi:maleylpyruvate isomerase family mycothiol-dependent enzyme [Micromonospora sp. CB01531]|uniref:maleylpyruvate isomerase family mycothiol-dependent enzyme n=1 Tax=Micromonospora sp. CB01531 TaxID=1718947 RepID=UPI000ACDA09B|nr:maleylpyruvate isomerase family mycothiol-dependent enzyme [Micromonospora sp. CB01531]